MTTTPRAARTADEWLRINAETTARIRAQVARQRCKCPAPVGTSDRCERCCLTVRTQAKGAGMTTTTSKPATQ